MLKKSMAACAIASLFFGAACLTDAEAVLYVVINHSIPDTTSDAQLGIGGEVFRTPQQQDAILVVTVTGGLITVADTANLHGIFSITVPLATNEVNHLSLTAADNTGASTTGALQWAVVHVDAPPLTQAPPG